MVFLSPTSASVYSDAGFFIVYSCGKQIGFWFWVVLIIDNTHLFFIPHHQNPEVVVPLLSAFYAGFLFAESVDIVLLCVRL